MTRIKQKNIEANNSHKSASQKKKSATQDTLDIWGDASKDDNEVVSKKQTRRLNNINEGFMTVPGIQKPAGGLSYNPTPDSHNKLLENIVELDDKLVNGAKYQMKEKDYSKRDAQISKVKPRSKKEQKVLQELEVKKKIKERKLMEYNFGKYLKDAKKDVKTHEKKLEDRSKHQEDIKNKLATGELAPVRRKIGHGKYVPRHAEFEDIDEMKGTLKDTSGNVSNLLRDQYDNVFRTGKIEPVKAGKNKQRRYRTYKAHNIFETSMEMRKIRTAKTSGGKKEDDLEIL